MCMHNVIKEVGDSQPTFSLGINLQFDDAYKFPTIFGEEHPCKVTKNVATKSCVTAKNVAAEPCQADDHVVETMLAQTYIHLL